MFTLSDIGLKKNIYYSRCVYITQTLQDFKKNNFVMDYEIGPVDSAQVIRSSCSFHLYYRIQSHYVISRHIVRYFTCVT
jgi:hypothetical protein